jgi:hypothetical protein
MRISRLLLLVCVLAIAFSSAANAALYTWWYPSSGGNWEDSTKWDPAGVPSASGDQANIFDGVCYLNSAKTITVAIIGFGTTHQARLVVNPGASFTTDLSEVIVGIVAGPSSANLDVEAGGTATLASLRVAGEAVGSTDFVTIKGDVTVTSFGTYIGTRWDNTPRGTGIVDIYGDGSLTVDGMGAMGNRIDIYAGSSVNLHGGNSVLRLLGDRTAELQNWIDLGRVTGRSYALYSDPAAGGDGYTYAVPEPATLVLLGIGGLLLRRKR